MGVGTGRCVVRVEFLESVRASLLLPFLRPHRAELAALGMPADDEPGSERWRKRLVQALNREDGALPPRLMSALILVHGLNSEAGLRNLTEHARALGTELHYEGQRLSAPDAALYAYVHHPLLFRLAYRGLRQLQCRGHAEFLGARALGTAELPVVRERLRGWVGSQAASRFPVAHVEERDEQLVFEFAQVVSGRGERDQAAREPAPFHEVQDVVTFYKRSGRLSVSTERPEHEDLYREMAGIVLASTPSHFKSWPVYSCAPFLEMGRGALETDDCAGLSRVCLTEIRVRNGKDDGQRIYQGQTAWTWLEETIQSGNLFSSTIVFWRLRVALHGSEEEFTVDVLPPNRLRVDGRMALHALDGFMETKGFYRPFPIPSR